MAFLDEMNSSSRLVRLFDRLRVGEQVAGTNSRKGWCLFFRCCLHLWAAIRRELVAMNVFLDVQFCKGEPLP